MCKKSDAGASQDWTAIEPPSANSLSARSRIRARSRSILLDAAICFIATALGSLSPQALGLLDLTPARPIAVNLEPDSGKFTDRVLVGGLRPISWEKAEIAPAPAFLAAPQPTIEDGGAPALDRIGATTPAKPAKEVGARRAERAAETVAPPPAPVVNESVAPETKAAAEQGAFAALTPANVSSKLAPFGQKIWSGAKSLGGAVTSGLSWFGY
jgi:hypothetical protein